MRNRSEIWRPRSTRHPCWLALILVVFVLEPTRCGVPQTNANAAPFEDRELSIRQVESVERQIPAVEHEEDLQSLAEDLEFMLKK